MTALSVQRRAQLWALVDAAAPAAVVGDRDTVVSGIAYDSRLVVSGDLFAALRGGYADGHDFAATAAVNGAAALLVERRLDVDLPQVLVDDARAALAPLSAAFYGSPSKELAVVGITGTDGKTTTSYIADHLLRASGHRTGLLGTIAVRIGDVEDRHAARQTTPESADVQRLLREMVEANIGWAVVEATSHGLAMHRLDDVRFAVAAVTNITHEHLDFHGSVEAYRRAKAILFERVAAEHGVAVVNMDDEGARSVLPLVRGASLVGYSTRGAPAELRAVEVSLDSRGSRFALEMEGRRHAVELPLLGLFNVENATCAAAIAVAAGVELRAVARALSDVAPIPGRMARIDHGQPFAVVVDYAHTPASLEKVLRLLRDLHPAGRLLTVFGSAGERDVEKRSVQGAVATHLADVAVFTSEDPRFEDAAGIVADIAKGAVRAGGREGVTFHQVVDRRQAISLALALAAPGDCVLLAGKGHEGSMIWGADKLPWDEANVAATVLIEMGYSVGSRPVASGR